MGDSSPSARSKRPAFASFGSQVASPTRSTARPMPTPGEGPSEESLKSPSLSQTSRMGAAYSSERIFPIASVVGSGGGNTNRRGSQSNSTPPLHSPQTTHSHNSTKKQAFDPEVSYFSARPSSKQPPRGSSPSINSLVLSDSPEASITPRSSQKRPSSVASTTDQSAHKLPEDEVMIDRAIAAREAADRQEPSSEVLMTVRFEHQETKDGHMIVTGRENEVTRCEDEPIRLPGAIQAWGVLMAMQVTKKGQFKIVQVSENSGHILGLSPSYLFGLDCFTDCLDEEEAEALREALQLIPTSDAELTESGPHFFELSGTGLPGSGLGGPDDCEEWTCWCTIHAPSRSQRPDLIVIEFELQDDPLNPPLTRPSEEISDDELQGLKHSEPYQPTEEDVRESTTNTARPLKKRSRRKKSAAYTDSDIFQTLNQVGDQLMAASDLQSFLKIVVGVIQDITNYHRVMVYQFDEAWNGQVVAELVDYSRTKDLYRGLHFPATDIPAQARELYRLNKFRQLYDRDQPTARMVCRNRAELEQPLDMTQVSVRAMSPIHIKYLANMGVRASGSVSITAFGSLWGLISCHSYGRYGVRMTAPQRQLLRVLGSDISRNIERLSYASRLHSRKLINTVSTEKNPSGYIIAKAEDLLTLFDAEFGCLSIGEEAKLLGPLDNSQEVLVVLEYLKRQKFGSIISSHDIKKDFPDLRVPGGFQVVAGLLLVPLTPAGRDFIVFFRRGQIKHIHWAGNPYDKVLKETQSNPKLSLEPRTSFKLWSEKVVGKCRAWSDDQLETASVLCLVYGKFISVWRQKEVAMRSNHLTNLLLSNASHEVRTPLNAIVNYLEMALDGPLDGDTRDALSKSYSASKALIHVINDLLDLTRAEAGQSLALKDPFDLPSSIEEAVSMHRNEAARRGISFEVHCTSPNNVGTVIGDRPRFKQVIANIVNNAVKHTNSGNVMLEWGEADASEISSVSSRGNGSEQLLLRFTITDTGVGMSESKLDSLFRQFEQVESMDEVKEEEEKEVQQSLGLGLAVVSRLVRNLGGQLRVESREGEGSTFTVILPFGKPEEAGLRSPSFRRSSSFESVHSRQSVNASLKSGSSGHASEIDSLVEAISSDHMQETEPQSSTISHASSVATSSSSTATRASPRLTGSAKPFLPNSNNNRTKKRGSISLSDQGTPLRAIRLPDDDVDTPTFGQNAQLEEHRNDPLRLGAALPTPPTSPAISPGLVAGPAAEATANAKASPSYSTPSWKNVSPGAQSSYDSSIPRELRVLVVEDDPINRAIIQKKLTKDGHTVDHAVHGEEAVRQIEKDSAYDIILMDIQMPICDGFTASKRIRGLDGGLNPDNDRRNSQSRIPIIAVSASLRESQRSEIMESGMDGWMLKPINFERMRRILDGAVNSEARRHELYRPGHFERGGWF